VFIDGIETYADEELAIQEVAKPRRGGNIIKQHRFYALVDVFFRVGFVFLILGFATPMLTWTFSCIE